MRLINALHLSCVHIIVASLFFLFQ